MVEVVQLYGVLPPWAQIDVTLNVNSIVVGLSWLQTAKITLWKAVRSQVTVLVPHINLVRSTKPADC